MSNPTPQQKLAAEQAIWAFNFGNYAMPDLDAAIHDDPEAQEWIPDLAAKVAAAVVGAEAGR